MRSRTPGWDAAQLGALELHIVCVGGCGSGGVLNLSSFEAVPELAATLGLTSMFWEGQF